MIRKYILNAGILGLLLVISSCAHQNERYKHDPSAQRQEQILKSKILAHYQNWRGVRHQLGGNSHSGIDCSAYSQRVYQSLFGIKIPRTSKLQKSFGKKTALRNIKTGDLLFFSPTLFSGHVGIYLGDSTFIHVSSSKGVSRSRIDSGYWKKHLRSARRVLP